MLAAYMETYFWTYLAPGNCSFRSHISGSTTEDILLSVPSRLVSVAGFAQARITLRLLTVHAVHPLLMRLPSRAPIH